MSLKLYEETDIQAIADATRAKTGTTDKYKVSQMPQAYHIIMAISYFRKSNRLYQAANYWLHCCNARIRGD